MSKADRGPATVDEYLAAVPAQDREALERLREQIRAAAPDAEEVVSYGIPLYRRHGDVVGFGAFKSHLSLFTTNSSVAERFATELEPFAVKHTTIHFSAERPLPADLVRRIVELRVAENER